MFHRTSLATLLGLLLLGLQVPSVHAGECEFLGGPEDPVPFAPNPETGLLELTVPITIGDRSFTADLEVAILGFLEVADDGSPRRALINHSWTLRENGFRLEWFGEADAFPTEDPLLVDYTLRLDIAASTGPYDTGSLFVQGVFNIVDATGDAGDWFGRLCTGGNGG